MQLSVAKALRRRFTRDQSGATAIEYALIAGGVSIAIITGVKLLGATVMNTFYVGLASLF